VRSDALRDRMMREKAPSDGGSHGKTDDRVERSAASGNNLFRTFEAWLNREALG